MVMAYFTDLLLVLKALHPKLNRRGRAFIAVGNSQYEGVLVDVRRILNDLAPPARFRVLESLPIRSMRSSAQQGGNHDLTESLVVLERD